VETGRMIERVYTVINELNDSTKAEFKSIAMQLGTILGKLDK
jgi:hypothetical protein